MEFFLLLPFFLLLIFGAIWWSSSRSQTIIEDWAQQNNYRLLESNAPLLNKGPFFWTTSKGQTVYRFTIEDQTGRTRSGWARCGSWMLGLMSEQIEVRWDDE